MGAWKLNFFLKSVKAYEGTQVDSAAMDRYSYIQFYSGYLRTFDPPLVNPYFPSYDLFLDTLWIVFAEELAGGTCPTIEKEQASMSATCESRSVTCQRSEGFTGIGNQFSVCLSFARQRRRTGKEGE